MMDKWQIDECLNSMIVLVDSREQDTDRAQKRYAAIDRPIKRCKLDYGDYAYNFVMPGQEWLYDTTDNCRIQLLTAGRIKKFRAYNEEKSLLSY